MTIEALIVLAHQTLLEIQDGANRAALLARCAMELVHLPELCADDLGSIDLGLALACQEAVKALELPLVSVEATEKAEFQGQSDAPH